MMTMGDRTRFQVMLVVDVDLDHADPPDNWVREVVEGLPPEGTTKHIEVVDVLVEEVVKGSPEEHEERKNKGT
jgi:hypothetical protein